MRKTELLGEELHTLFPCLRPLTHDASAAGAPLTPPQKRSVEEETVSHNNQLGCVCRHYAREEFGSALPCFATANYDEKPLTTVL